MTQVFDDDRLEEIAEFIKDELGRLLGRDADSPMSQRIQKRYGRLATIERLIATLWALNECQTNVVIQLATMDIEDVRITEPNE